MDEADGDLAQFGKKRFTVDYFPPLDKQVCKDGK